jgi:hypothetical protein
MARLLRASGVESRVEPQDQRSGFTLPELYRLLRCETVEFVALGEGYVMALDEDGKSNPRLARNDVATMLLHATGGMPSDYVVGDVLVVVEGEFK